MSGGQVFERTDCDGSAPHSFGGEVRVLPIAPADGSGGNLILCRRCFVKELAFRRERNRSLSPDVAFALPAWESLAVYGGAP